MLLYLPDTAVKQVVVLRYIGNLVCNFRQRYILQLMAAEGNGPVNALDQALRKALEIFYPVLSQVKLTDYKVRVLDSKDATAAGVRVLITSTDGEDTFTTVGVSGDVVAASWKALEDSMEYLLLKNAAWKER